MRMCVRDRLHVCARVGTRLRLRMCLYMHVRARVGEHACAGADWCAYICMYDHYIILLYMRAQCVRTFVGTCVGTGMNVRSSERICVRVCGRMSVCVRECAYVRVRMCIYVCS